MSFEACHPEGEKELRQDVTHDMLLLFHWPNKSYRQASPSSVNWKVSPSSNIAIGLRDRDMASGDNGLSSHSSAFSIIINQYFYIKLQHISKEHRELSCGVFYIIEYLYILSCASVFTEVYPIFEYPWLQRGLVETHMPTFTHNNNRIEMFQSKQTKFSWDTLNY